MMQGVFVEVHQIFIKIFGSARTYHKLLILVRPGDVRPQSVVNVLQSEDVKLQ